MTTAFETTLSRSEVRMLKKAFAKLLRDPAPGAVAFCRCLRPEFVEALAATQDFAPGSWDVRAVTETTDLAVRQITSDQAVELREDKGDGVLLLINSQRAGAGMDGIYSASREITEEDVEDVIKNAKAINLPAENHVLHAIRQHFLVDGQDGIVNPVGMLGARVEVDMHVVHGIFNRLQNPIRTVKGLQLEVEAIVFNGLASSLALLTSEQKEMGALVIDIGGGTTEYIVYTGGIIKHTGVLAVGGDHISNDLAYGLKIPLGKAEELKIQHGSACVEESDKGQTSTTNDALGLPLKSVNIEHLRRIMALRVGEIFELIEQELSKAGLIDYLRAGVLICGGGARIPGIQKLAEKVFQLPASLGKTTSISGLKSALDQPEFSTAIGLVKFGSFQQKKKPGGNSLAQALKDTFAGFKKKG